MANSTTLTRLHGHSRYGVAWYQSFLGDGSTYVKTTQTLSGILCWGAVVVVAHFRNAAWTDGTFTMTLQGSNDNSNWSGTLGVAATAVGSASQEVSTGIAEGSATTTGTVGVGVNLPRYIRPVITVTAAPGTGTLISFVYVKLVYAGDESAVV